MTELSILGVVGVVVFCLVAFLYLMACAFEWAESTYWPYPTPAKWTVPGIWALKVLVLGATCFAWYAMFTAFKEIFL